LGRILSKKNKK